MVADSINRPSSSANAPSTTSAVIDSDAHVPAPPLIPTFEAIPGEGAPYLGHSIPITLLTSDNIT